MALKAHGSFFCIVNYALVEHTLFLKYGMLHIHFSLLSTRWCCSSPFLAFLVEYERGISFKKHMETNDQPEKRRAKSPPSSVMQRFDNFLSDWRRKRSDSSKQQTAAGDPLKGAGALQSDQGSPAEGSPSSSTSPPGVNVDATIAQEIAPCPSTPASQNEAAAPTTKSDDAVGFSLSMALERIARKHGVYYAEGTIVSRSPSLQGSSAPGAQDDRGDTLKQLLIDWAAAAPRRKTSCLHVAALSHLHPRPQLVTTVALTELETVRWPLLQGVSVILQEQRDEREAKATVVPPLCASVEANTSLEALTPSTPTVPAEQQQLPTIDPSTSYEGNDAVRQLFHTKHRLLDFYERYDPQRIPTEEQVQLVIDSGIPEQVLFPFLQHKYGLSTLTGLFLPHHSIHGEGGSPTNHAAAASGEGASPDFGVYSSTPMPSHCTLPTKNKDDDTVTSAAVDTTQWCEAWKQAVMPLVPKVVVAEIAADSSTWNSQSSKPGLANPRTLFPNPREATQVFTFLGGMVELQHKELQACVLSCTTKYCAPLVAPPITHGDAVLDYVALGDVLMFPRSQAAVLRYHRNLRSAEGEVPTHTSDDVAAFAARMEERSSAVDQKKHRSIGANSSRHSDREEWISDWMADSMLHASLQWASPSRSGRSGHNTDEYHPKRELGLDDVLGWEAVDGEISDEDIRSIQSPIEMD